MCSQLDSCRRIWQECFSDSPEFIDLYFSRRYTPQNTFVSTYGAQIVAQAQCFIYKMSGNDHLPPTTIGYISGLATLPHFQRQGHASNVMQQIHHWLHSCGADYSTLIPANQSVAEWYSKQFLYRHGCTYRKFPVRKSFLEQLHKLDQPTATLLHSMSNALSQRPLTLQHTAADLEDQLRVCMMSGGGAYCRYSPDKQQFDAIFFVEYRPLPHSQSLWPFVIEVFDFQSAINAQADDAAIMPHLWSEIEQTPIYSLPICAQQPMPASAHFSLMLD